MASYQYFSLVRDLKQLFKGVLFPLMLCSGMIYLTSYLYPILTAKEKTVVNGSIIEYSTDTVNRGDNNISIRYNAIIETYDSSYKEYDRKEYQTTRETYLDFTNKCHNKYVDTRYHYVEGYIILTVLLILLCIASVIFAAIIIFNQDN
jgi:hypothetical protein